MVVVSLGPGKFYGTSLPRPRIYNDVKFNDHRVDPPVPVSDPFMSWANEAHWSMGGLSFQRLRLQGKIEGNVEKLRKEREKLLKNRSPSPASLHRSDLTVSKRGSSVSPPPAPVLTKRRRFMAMIDDAEDDDEEDEEKEGAKEGGVVVANRRGVRRRLVKKLGDDFDRVAVENDESNVSDLVAAKVRPLKGSGNGLDSGDGSDSVALKTRNRRLRKVGDVKVVEEANESKSKGKKSKSEGDKIPVSASGFRTSPRLAKRESNSA